MKIFSENAREAFDRHWCDYLRYKANLEHINRSDPEKYTEEWESKYAECLEHLERSQRLLMTTCAITADRLWRKFEVLEDALITQGDGPSYTDNRHLWMLAGIKADLIRFGSHLQ